MDGGKKNLNFWELATLHLCAISLLQFIFPIISKSALAGSMSLAKIAQKGGRYYREQVKTGNGFFCRHVRFFLQTTLK
jgi:hypothetical protein